MRARLWATGVLLRLLAVLACASGCQSVFYQPSRRVLGWPSQQPNDVFFASSDGTPLHGWWFEATKPRRGTVVQFHGNAGNITSHFRSVIWMTDWGYDVFTFDYRGYGRSQGEPSAEGLHRDAQAAMAVALGRAKAHLPSGNVVLYGQSLGGAVMLRALADLQNREGIGAAVVEGSFHSYREMAAAALWSVPVLRPLTAMGYSLVSDEWSPYPYVSDVSPIPLLVLHDARDPVVPVGFGEALYGLAREPRAMWVTNRGEHIRAAGDPLVRQAMVRWLQAAEMTRQTRNDALSP